MNAYVRAAAKHPTVRQQALERKQARAAVPPKPVPPKPVPPKPVPPKPVPPVAPN